jgi:hypothetical protein
MSSLRVVLRILAVLGIAFTYRALYPATSAQACEYSVIGGNFGCISCGCLENQPSGYSDCHPGESCGLSCYGQSNRCLSS